MDDSLRGRSYLYTYLRLSLKNALQYMGYEPSNGLQAFELFPNKYKDIVNATIARTAATLHAVIRQYHIRACVIIVPYEMQVSAEAARRYKELGFKWEDEFEGGSTQRCLMAGFKAHDVNAFDALDAFRGLQLRVGEAFVYDKGDKIDWNHPNRKGHAIIAAWLAGNQDFISRCFGPVDKN